MSRCCYHSTVPPETIGRFAIGADKRCRPQNAPSSLTAGSAVGNTWLSQPANMHTESRALSLSWHLHDRTLLDNRLLRIMVHGCAASSYTATSAVEKKNARSERHRGTDHGLRQLPSCSGRLVQSGAWAHRCSLLQHSEWNKARTSIWPAAMVRILGGITAFIKPDASTQLLSRLSRRQSRHTFSTGFRVYCGAFQRLLVPCAAVHHCNTEGSPRE